ncbi:hypothetical protein LX36DRAFT_484397 [Colletotrichum falcatum]|nr:hypothetical protein LX36DRAFT_484397 [Colletotrichum falcatum]
MAWQGPAKWLMDPYWRLRFVFFPPRLPDQYRYSYLPPTHCGFSWFHKLGRYIKAIVCQRESPYRLFKANQWPSHYLGRLYKKKKKVKCLRISNNSSNQVGFASNQYAGLGLGISTYPSLSGFQLAIDVIYADRPASQGDVSVTTDSAQPTTATFQKDLSGSCKLIKTWVVIPDTCGNNNNSNKSHRPYEGP